MLTHSFVRDGMDRRDWLSLIAVHSDSWLISMAYFNAARLDAEGRWAGAEAVMCDMDGSDH